MENGTDRKTLAPGAKELEDLRLAGFTNQEIVEHRNTVSKQLQDAGFSAKEIDEHFGVVEPDMSATKEYFKANLEKSRSLGEAPKPTGIPAPQEANPSVSHGATGSWEPESVKVADSFLDSLEAGYQMSVTGLISRGKMPTTVLPEHADMFDKIASQVGTMAGDLPAMIAGTVAGGQIGATTGAVTGGLIGAPIAGIGAIPGVAAGAAAGTVIGGGYGAMALPEALRKILVDHYEKGDIQTFDDFWSRSAATFLEANHAGIVGAATAGVGGTVAKVASPLSSPLIKTTATATSEVATMVTVGKALEGEVPNAEDFTNAAVLVAGLTGATHVAGKLRTIYAKTGMKPDKVFDEAAKNPILRQDLLTEGAELPRSISAPGKTNAIEGSKPLEIEIPKIEKPIQKTRSSSNEKPLWSPSKEKESAPITFDGAYRQYMDDLHPLKQFSEVLSEGKPLKTGENPYDLARLTRGTYGKADQFIDIAPFNFKTLENTGSKPLREILSPFKDDLDGFRDFAVSKRAIELQSRGIESGVDSARAAKIVSEGSAKYQKSFDDLVQYQNDVTAYLRDSGILSNEAFKAMTEANKSYVPFFRLLEESGSKGVGKGLNVQNPVREIKGSDKTVIDPIESIIKNTYSYVTLAERNRVLTTMVELAEKNQNLGSKLMEKVQAKQRPVEVKPEEVQRFLDEHGIKGDAEAFTIFRPEKQVLAKDEIAVFRDGKREVYRVAPEVSEAVKALDRESLGLVMRILAKPASWLRAGSTLAPDFIMRNAIRDQMTAFSFSKNGYVPVVSMLDGLGSLLKKDEHYSNWLKSGGANSTMVAMDRVYIQENIFKLSKETGLIDRTWNVMKSPIELLRVSSELIENSTRIGEFKRATKGATDANSLFNAGLQSREVTLDFARVGAQTRAMNAISAFWNAHVQGLDRSVRAIKERPVQTTAKLAASITLPSVLLWWANKDDPRWQEIPRWQKDLFWIVMTDDHIYRIPKPAELGILFGSVPERVLEQYFTENPNAMKDLEETIGKSLIPEYMPNAVIPFIEHFANRSTFTQRQLIPANLEGIAPKYQYTEYTSETAKMLGKLITPIPVIGETSAASPAVIENYIRSWSGNMGQYALQLADKAFSSQTGKGMPAKPLSTLADMPVIKAFVVRYPSATAQSIQDFYDRSEKIETKWRTVEHLQKSLQYDAAELESQRLIQENMPRLKGIREGLGNMSRQIHLINAMPDMTPEEKRQQIDMLYDGMIQGARVGNQIIREMEDRK